MEIVRDPLWNNIRIDELALQLIDTPVFQRLRYIKQLGHTYLVYPGATHTRFEHALGAYHLCKVTLALLKERGELSNIDPRTYVETYVAALLHDVGHYPFSHALEEIGATHHEDVAYPLITEGRIADILARELGADAPERIHALIKDRSTSPLQGLISGSLDLDKIEYLKRDAHMCGVPYGEIDTDRLINSLVLVPHATGNRQTIGVLEKGLSALESLLFAKYQMYRNVYWHHAVRSATAMYKRLVEDAIVAEAVTTEQLTAFTDEGLIWHLEQYAPSRLLDGIRNRKLYKRASEWPSSEVAAHDEVFLDWIGTDRERTRAAEKELARVLKLSPDDILLDYPEKTQMLGLDIPVVRRNGEIEQLTGKGIVGIINLPKLSKELYSSSRWLRVFTAERNHADKSLIFEVIAAS